MEYPTPSLPSSILTPMLRFHARSFSAITRVVVVGGAVTNWAKVAGRLSLVACDALLQDGGHGHMTSDGM